MLLFAVCCWGFTRRGKFHVEQSMTTINTYPPRRFMVRRIAPKQAGGVRLTHQPPARKGRDLARVGAIFPLCSQVRRALLAEVGKDQTRDTQRVPNLTAGPFTQVSLGIYSRTKPKL